MPVSDCEYEYEYEISVYGMVRVSLTRATMVWHEWVWQEWLWHEWVWWSMTKVSIPLNDNDKYFILCIKYDQ